MTQLSRAFVSGAASLAVFVMTYWLLGSVSIIGATKVFSIPLAGLLAYVVAHLLAQFVNVRIYRFLERRFGNSIWEE